ncbi:MAG: cytochrome c [Acidobacteriota bacterium]|nr:cytochrome c [Acidobacteriota bacterium]
MRRPLPWSTCREHADPAAAHARPRWHPALAAALAALLAGVVGGCGSGAAGVSGRAVFRADCQVCHSISGHSAPTQQGGDLRRLRLPRAELLQYAAEMPVITRRLTRAELRAVVAYLQSRQRR